MTIKNRYIYVESTFESELVQTLLFEAGAGWLYFGKTSINVSDSHIVINEKLEMSVRAFIPEGCKELTLHELATMNTGETAMETETLHVCKVSDNYISFEDSEVAMTPDELSELLRVIHSISHRDFEITIKDEDVENGERFPLTNLTINFK